jgi:hypothetical protein
VRTKPPFNFLPLLAQHPFAHAAAIFWQISGFRQTSHSGGALHGNSTFRCALAELADGLLPSQQMQVQN